MTVASGLGLLFLGIPITVVFFYVIFKAEAKFEKERQNENTTTRDY